MANKYGTWQKKSRYGRIYTRIVRTTYLIDQEGKIAKRWDNVKVDGHVEQALEAVNDSLVHWIRASASSASQFLKSVSLCTLRKPRIR